MYVRSRLQASPRASWESFALVRLARRATPKAIATGCPFFFFEEAAIHGQ